MTFRLSLEVNSGGGSLAYGHYQDKGPPVSNPPNTAVAAVLMKILGFLLFNSGLHQESVLKTDSKPKPQLSAPD